MKSSQAPNVLATHIMPTAATMVGVCLTGIGLVKVAERQIGPSHVDELLSYVSLLFCMSTLFSYGSIRWQGKIRAVKYERMADLFFTIGMVCMVVICVLFAFDIV